MARDFECAPGLRLEALEQVSELQIAGLEARLNKLEALQERLERRLWLAVYGIAAVFLSQAADSIIKASQ